MRRMMRDAPTRLNVCQPNNWTTQQINLSKLQGEGEELYLTFTSLHVKNVDTSSAAAFNTKLGISAFARPFQYVGNKLIPHAPFTVSRTKFARNLAVWKIWKPPQAVANMWVKSEAKLVEGEQQRKLCSVERRRDVHVGDGLIQNCDQRHSEDPELEADEDNVLALGVLDTDRKSLVAEFVIARNARTLTQASLERASTSGPA